MEKITNKSGIYCYENLIDHKKYIGKANNLSTRIGKHEYMLKKDICPNEENVYFWNSVKKYGRENFQIIILEICDFEELNKKEIYYIDKLNSKYPNGYNFTVGGEGCSGYKWTDEQKTNLPNRKGENNSQYGKDFSIENNPAFGKKHKNSSSKYFGVSIKNTKYGKKWRCHLQVNNKHINIGIFSDEIAAAKAYDKFVEDNNLPHPLNFKN